jgi:hypothetical protein
MMKNSFEIRNNKITETVKGCTFEEILAAETKSRIKRIIEKSIGRKIKPGEKLPHPGTFSIVSENILDTWWEMLKINGLSFFAENISADRFIKKEPIFKEGVIEIRTTPVWSQPLIHFPEPSGKDAQLSFRIIIIAPVFLDSIGRPAYKDLPEKYISSVLNTLNPAVLYAVYKKDLSDKLKLAGSNADSLESILKFCAAEWKDRAVPNDYKTLQDYLHFAVIHEICHALVLHLPDTENKHDDINYDMYLKILSSETDIQKSAVFCKNIYKALESANKLEARNCRNSYSDIINIIALETMCDRFSMFLYEKYKEVEINKERAEHLYSRVFGDPPVTDSEKKFFSGFLKLLQKLDAEKKIFRFSNDHFKRSRFIRMTLPYISEKWNSLM